MRTALLRMAGARPAAGKRDAAEEELQHGDRVGNVQLAVVVGIRRSRAGQRGRAEQIAENGDRIRNVEVPIGIGIPEISLQGKAAAVIEKNLSPARSHPRRPKPSRDRTRET